MANLNTKTIADGVLDILAVDGGVDASTARNIKDGDGTVTPLWLTTTKLGIGVIPSAPLHVYDTSDNAPNIIFEHASATPTQGCNVLLRLKDTNSVLADNSVIGDVAFQAWDGDEYFTSAMVRSSTEGATSNGSSPADLTFWTNAGAISATQRMIINKDGKVGIGTASPEAYLHVNQDTDLGHSVGDQQIFFKTSGDSDNNDQLEISQIRTSTNSSADDWYSSQWRIQRKVDSTYMSWIGFGGEEGSGENNFGISFGIGGASDTSPLDADEAMRIEGSNGYVGIGTKSPGDNLHVKGSDDSDYLFRLEHTDADNPRGMRIDFSGYNSASADTDFYAFGFDSDDTTRWRIDGKGNFENVSGEAISAISDERLKENITDYTGGLSVINALKPRTFTWKSGVDRGMTGTRYGFIAQEIMSASGVEDAMAMARKSPTVDEDGQAIKDLCTDGFIHRANLNAFECVLISAIKELTAKVTALENA